jgi:hypothetical protein
MAVCRRKETGLAEITLSAYRGDTASKDRVGRDAANLVRKNDA